MDLFDLSDKGATFSECRKFRYRLWRIWDTSLPLLMFIGLNPSIADQGRNDPTITRVIGFAKRWGYGGFYMMNCYPLISPHPSALRPFVDTPFYDIELEINDKYLRETADKVARVVFCWGACDLVTKTYRAKYLRAMFPEAWALVINADGSPRHPLYVAQNTELIKYP